MAERAPSVFVVAAVPSLPNLLQQVLSDSNNKQNSELLEALMEVVVNAATATQQVTSQKDDNTPIIPYAIGKTTDKVDPSSPVAELGRACLPLLLEPLSATLESSTWNNIMQLWAASASTCPSLLAGEKAILETVLRICLTCANTQREDATVALAALEVISSLFAVGDVRRKILAADTALMQRALCGDGSLQGIISLAAQHMISGTDDNLESWANEPATLLDDDEWDGDDDAIYAESLLQSFLHSLSSPALDVALPLVEKLLQSNQDWRQTRAALSMLEACLASAPVSFASHVPVAMEAALNFAGQEHSVRVQYQALRLLGILCEMDAAIVNSNETVRQHYGHRILQTLAQSVHSPCTKVSSLASLAIVSFCRGGSTGKINTDADNPHPVLPYLSDLLQALVAGPLSLEVVCNNSINQGAVVAKTRAIGSVACLAEASGESFVPFYGNIMPGLLACSQLQQRGNYEVSQLIGASIEAATIIGQAIESDEDCRNHYVSDAKKIMQFIIPILQQADTNASVQLDLPLDPLLSACARIASVTGAEYAPFVNLVLPILLKRATAPPDVSISDGEESGLEATKRNGLEIDEELGTESMTVAVPGKGIQKFTINTSKIQEKAQAARAIYEHACALSGDFGPYIQHCLEAFVPLISFQFSAEVRSTSAQAVASVFEAACSSVDDSATDISKLQQYLPLLAKTLAKQIQSESTSEMEALYALADSLSEVYYSVYQRMDTYGRQVASSLSLDDAGSTVEMVMGAISSCLQRRHDIYGVLSGANGALTGDDEKEECEAQLREEEKLLTPLVDSVGYTLKFLKEKFVPIFDGKVSSILGPCLTNGDIRARLCAVCLFDDCVEHCGSAAAAKYSEKLIYGAILGIDDQSNGGDLELKSASIYGISQICRYAPSSVLAPHAETIFHHLLQVVRSCSKEESEFPMMYENTISALASLTLIGNAPFANNNFIKREEMMCAFVDNLPLREDGDEAKVRTFLVMKSQMPSLHWYQPASISPLFPLS